VSVTTVSRGRRVVFAVYVVVIAIAGLMGAIIGATRPDIVDPVLFGVIPLPASALGMAIYGMVTVGVGLGVLLLAVSYVAARFDTHEPGRE
jgi:hypothetical protein